MAPATLPATVYRLAGIAPTTDAMFEATSTGRLAAPGVDVMELDIDGSPAVLYFRQHPPSKAGWTPGLSALTGVSLPLIRQDCEAVLIVAAEPYVYGIGFGQGYLAVVDSREPGFGLHCALRAVDPARVRDVDRRALGGLPRHDSTYVPDGIPIGGVGIRDYAELVKKLGGLIKAADLGLNHRESVSVEGADGLRLPIPLEPTAFRALLHRLNEISEREVPPDFERLEAIRPVGSESLRDKLDALLDEALRGQGDARLHVAVPVALVDLRHEARSYRIKVGSVAIVREELDLDDLRRRCKVQHCTSPSVALRDGTIEMCADREGKEPIGRARAIRWFEAVAAIGSRIYQLSDGEWYECGAGYVESMRHRLQELIVPESEVTMLPWRAGESEEKYNMRMQNTFGRGRYLCLDRQFSRTRQQRRGKGYEACDGLTDRHTLVHVKAAHSSEPLSHQFAQALISIRTLYNEPDARTKFSAKVAELSGGLLTVPENFVPGKIVLAILLKGKELTPDSLYPFAQVALVALADTLQRDHGAIVEVVGIPSNSSAEKGSGEPDCTTT
ncbi:DUF6119 family protein [Streptosporangium sp. NPDC001559]|uniref:DUF6119 family protein n=1 Tax=Streptosporangium sp. NPDC001559 TaxID=3366187 RepID=UPI0036E9E026